MPLSARHRCRKLIAARKDSRLLRRFNLTFVDIDGTACTTAVIQTLQKANKDLGIQMNGMRH